MLRQDRAFTNDVNVWPKVPLSGGQLICNIGITKPNQIQDLYHDYLMCIACCCLCTLMSLYLKVILCLFTITVVKYHTVCCYGA